MRTALTWCFCSRDGRIRTDDLSVPKSPGVDQSGLARTKPQVGALDGRQWTAANGGVRAIDARWNRRLTTCHTPTGCSLPPHPTLKDSNRRPCLVRAETVIGPNWLSPRIHLWQRISAFVASRCHAAFRTRLPTFCLLFRYAQLQGTRPKRTAAVTLLEPTSDWANDQTRESSMLPGRSDDGRAPAW